MKKKNLYIVKQKFKKFVNSLSIKPYSHKNQIEKYSELKVVNVILLENDRMICCEAIKAY